KQTVSISDQDCPWQSLNEGLVTRTVGVIPQTRVIHCLTGSILPRRSTRIQIVFSKLLLGVSQSQRAFKLRGVLSP
ncbi:hypothetical protein AnigIFM60653_006207, partial [Aspergillus niger]